MYKISQSDLITKENELNYNDFEYSIIIYKTEDYSYRLDDQAKKGKRLKRPCNS